MTRRNREKRQVSTVYNDLVILRPKKQIASTFNIEQVQNNEEETGDIDSVISCKEMKQLSDCYDDVLKENLQVIIKEEADTEGTFKKWITFKIFSQKGGYTT